jgi:hypothetical protein
MGVIRSVYRDDTFIVSYPKSGNTWVRFFVANLLRGDATTDLTTLDQLVPDPAKVDDSTLERLPRPRFLKSHQAFTPLYPRVLYLVRDVRAVVTSYYRQRQRMGVIPPTLPIGEFVRMFIDGIGTQFGAWDAHVIGWLQGAAESQGRSQFRCVRYEDMISDGPKTFRSIAEFLQMKRTDTQISDALSLSSFQRMRELELKAGRAWPEKRDAKDMAIPFMHSGVVDSWQRDLDEVSKRLLVTRFGYLLSVMGYPV